ncbi:hypothetical protein MRB53_013855 [Persea americana]|uniref:Uncharacterized protein n=1 Tax=Persea americana TaxID=3435 RepID=A0ACC2K9P3_PERAE|nr:hypothetical protein MRB53_013855 [Persea americana]
MAGTRLSCRAGGGAGTGPLDAYGCATKAGAGTELRTVGALNKAAEPRGGAGTRPLDAYGCAAKDGAGTELRTVGALNRAAKPRGGAGTGPLGSWYSGRIA